MEEAASCKPEPPVFEADELQDKGIRSRGWPFTLKAQHNAHLKHLIYSIVDGEYMI